ncbi:conserved hypothetical protein [Vibrio phage 501E54-1]|nr:conserved hypothetical protein [Vibrio phage 501E54-1]
MECSMKPFKERLAMLQEELDSKTPEEVYAELQSYPKGGAMFFPKVEISHEESRKQTIQSFLNCCIMETQGENLTHNDLAKLLEFYFNDEMYCEGLSCYQLPEN